ncbi:MAG: hypothetical protein OXK80_02680 [Bdellovibrionales bacterium]|nr:hypothetical protein [Bdellovibrionales bacterium]
MNKTDRLIITFSIGVLLISTAYTISTVRKQNIEKENIKIARSEREVLKTFDLIIQRRYHEEQKALLQEVLKELRKNKTQTISTQCL